MCEIRSIVFRFVIEVFTGSGKKENNGKEYYSKNSLSRTLTVEQHLFGQGNIPSRRALVFDTHICMCHGIKY